MFIIMVEIKQQTIYYQCCLRQQSQGAEINFS
jgi:hypothetical protein